MVFMVAHLDNYFGNTSGHCDFFAKSLNLVLIFLALYYLITAMYIGPSVSVVQSLFPAEMRAFASSIFLFVLNSIGLGLVL